MDFYNEIKNAVGGENVLLHERMADHTTFRIGGEAQYFVPVKDEEMLRRGIGLCGRCGVPYYIVGKGSNLLVGDKGYRGVIFHICRHMDEMNFDILPDRVYVTCGAGALLTNLAKMICSHGYEGMEYAVGIPGTMGGAVAMNAGAYGGQIADSICWADVMDKSGRLLHLTKENLRLGYRTSAVLSKEYIVLRVCLLFYKGDADTIARKAEENALSRKRKQPLEYPSAGSTFKRPEGYFAGKLIEDCGLKGYTIGGAQVSEKHSGFIINKGGATASDVRALIRRIQAEVWQRFGVRIEPEIRMIGEFTED